MLYPAKFLLISQWFRTDTHCRLCPAAEAPVVTLRFLLAGLHLAIVEADFYSMSRRVEEKLHVCFQQAGHSRDLHTY